MVATDQHMIQVFTFNYNKDLKKYMLKKIIGEIGDNILNDEEFTLLMLGSIETISENFRTEIYII